LINKKDTNKRELYDLYKKGEITMMI
jgi:hypothetical protein